MHVCVWIRKQEVRWFGGSYIHKGDVLNTDKYPPMLCQNPTPLLNWYFLPVPLNKNQHLVQTQQGVQSESTGETVLQWVFWGKTAEIRYPYLTHTGTALPIISVQLFHGRAPSSGQPAGPSLTPWNYVTHKGVPTFCCQRSTPLSSGLFTHGEELGIPN